MNSLSDMKSDTKKVLPTALTSYDLLKTAAIILMIVDHMGYYFFPEESWFRIFGRLCVPIWFFLIGYARTRDIPRLAIVGTLLLLVGSLIAGEYFFPLCILVTLMIGRYFIDILMRPARIGGESLAGLYFILFFLSFPTTMMFEYGTLVLLFTVFGGMCRYRQDFPQVREAGYDKQIHIFAWASFSTFVVIQCVHMSFLDAAQFSTLVCGMGAVALILGRFRMAEMTNMTAALPGFLVRVIQFTGRHTLEIYVAHLLVFKTLAVIYDPDRFVLMGWRWVPEGTAATLESLRTLL